MRTHTRKALVALSVGLVASGVIFAAPGVASAQGLFERLFGGFRRAVERPVSAPTAFADPFSSLARALNPPPPARRGEANVSRGFCVRTCDGHYFPVRAQANMSAAETCRAMCPASDTQLFAGSNIDYAVARDGSRYTNLDTAYAFRERVVDKCTCNGRTPFGLAQLDAINDPTLRPGDIVVTNNGLVAYSGKGKGEFTPVQSYAGFGKSTREQLSAIKVRVQTAAALETTSAIGSDRPAQAADNSVLGRSLVP